MYFYICIHTYIHTFMRLPQISASVLLASYNFSAGKWKLHYNVTMQKCLQLAKHPISLPLRELTCGRGASAAPLSVLGPPVSVLLSPLSVLSSSVLSSSCLRPPSSVLLSRSSCLRPPSSAPPSSAPPSSAPPSTLRRRRFPRSAPVTA